MLKLQISIVLPTNETIELSFEEAKLLYQTLKDVFEKN